METNKKKINSWLKNIINKHTPVGVYKEAKGYMKDKKARDNSITEASQLENVKKTGKRMSPSLVKDYMRGGGKGLFGKKNRVESTIVDYLKTKKRIKKEVT